MKLIHDEFGLIYEVKDKKPIFYSESLKMALEKGITVPVFLAPTLGGKETIQFSDPEFAKAFAIYYVPFILNRHETHYHWEKE